MKPTKEQALSEGCFIGTVLRIARRAWRGLQNRWRRYTQRRIQGRRFQAIQLMALVLPPFEKIIEHGEGWRVEYEKAGRMTPETATMFEEFRNTRVAARAEYEDDVIKLIQEHLSTEDVDLAISYYTGPLAPLIDRLLLVTAAVDVITIIPPNPDVPSDNDDDHPQISGTPADRMGAIRAQFTAEENSVIDSFLSTPTVAVLKKISSLAPMVNAIDSNWNTRQLEKCPDLRKLFVDSTGTYMQTHTPPGTQVITFPSKEAEQAMLRDADPLVQAQEFDPATITEPSVPFTP